MSPSEYSYCVMMGRKEDAKDSKHGLVIRVIQEVCEIESNRTQLFNNQMWHLRCDRDVVGGMKRKIVIIRG